MNLKEKFESQLPSIRRMEGVVISVVGAVVAGALNMYFVWVLIASRTLYHDLEKQELYVVFFVWVVVGVALCAALLFSVRSLWLDIKRYKEAPDRDPASEISDSFYCIIHKYVLKYPETKGALGKFEKTNGIIKWKDLESLAAELMALRWTYKDKLLGPGSDRASDTRKVFE